MLPRVLPLCLPLLVAVGGCLTEETGTLLVEPNPFGPPPTAAPPTKVAHAPATEEAEKRVVLVGQKILAANPQASLRAMLFITHGSPQPEVFHRDGRQLFVTEGLVRQCKTEGELAAVLCHELGKMVSEREALAGAGLRQPERPLPQEVRVGNEVGGTFGAPDGTHLFELSQYDRDRARPKNPSLPPPDPEALARRFLQQAGYPASDFDAVAGLLKTAAANMTTEKQLTAQPVRPQMP